MKSVVRYSTLLLAAFVSIVASGLLCESVLAAPPVISAVFFPGQFEVNSIGFGEILFQDIDQDVAFARLDVADGRYYRRVATPADEAFIRQGRLPFNLNCTSYGQKVTLAVTLFDSKGERSATEQMAFICGQPSVYNFDAEQREALPVNEQIPLNFFIIADDVTALADEAQFGEQNLLGTPNGAVFDAIRGTVIPKLTGIWDQCGFGFDLVNAWVVRPQDLQIAGNSLEQLLFSSQNGQRAIRYGRETADYLRQATLHWWRAAQREDARAASALNVLILGSSIYVEQNGSLAESEGFSESAWPSYAIVRWGASLNTVLPKQMISTLAHELGHNLGLAHPGEDDLHETLSDGMNLMLGSGVSPQPRANIIQSQCDRARTTYNTLKERLESQADHGPAAPAEASASVEWKQSCENQTCSGKVELMIEALGFADLDSFGFASFEYSNDGEKFTEIGVDRSYQDGFSMTWNTARVADGIYTLRVVVIDAKGIRASATLKVTVKNGT